MMMQNIKRFLAIALVSSLLSGCFSGDEKQTVDVETPPVVVIPPVETISLSGSVATGLATSGATIKVFDALGQEIELDGTVTTDEKGNFSIAFTGDSIPTPIIIEAQTDTGVMRTIVDSANAEVANINPITSFAADTVLVTSELSAITEGEFSTQGDAILESILGEGASFDAFAQTAFVARTSTADYSTQVSSADIILDALGESAATDGWQQVLSQASQAPTGLMETSEFQLTLATQLALMPDESQSISNVFDQNSESSQLVMQMTEVAESAADSFALTVADQGLTQEQQQAAMVAVLSIVSQSMSANETPLDANSLQAALDSATQVMAEPIIALLTDENVVAASAEELVQLATDAADEIVEVLEEANVDLTQGAQEAEQVIEKIEAVVADPVITTQNVRWGDVNWGDLEWQ